MGLLNGFFGKKNLQETKDTNYTEWNSLDSLKQLDELVEKSQKKPQIIFKHSTSCGISRMVIKMFKKNYGFSPDQLDLYYLDLHVHRTVSDEVEQKFQVVHQSPQLLVIRNGNAVANASHGAIVELDLRNFV